MRSEAASGGYDRVVADAQRSDPGAIAGRRRVGVMGGTFDPIHHGHLVAASEAAYRCGLSEVVFAPTGRPWQKAGDSVSNAEDRYAMTVLATSGRPDFSVSRVDLERSRPTYTVDTLRDLHDEHPDTELYFITGADTFAGINTWKAVDEVFTLARFITVNRPGYSVGCVEPPPGARVTSVEMPAMDISSTDCRRRVAAGEPIWYLVPEPVVRYIDSRGLYR